MPDFSKEGTFRTFLCVSGVLEAMNWKKSPQKIRVTIVDEFRVGFVKAWLSQSLGLILINGNGIFLTNQQIFCLKKILLTNRFWFSIVSA